MRIHSLPLSLLFSSVTAFSLAAHAAPASKPVTSSPTPVDVAPLRTAWTAADLTAACTAARKDTDAKLAALVAVPDDKRTFKDSFEAFDAITGSFSETSARLSFMKDIHKDAAVRDVAAECEEQSGKYAVELGARKDLYAAMQGYLAHAGKKDHLDAERKRLVELTMLDFKRSGLALSDADRTKLTAIRSRITELETKFGKNLNDDTSKLELSRDELAGLPESFIDAHADKTKKGVYVVTTKYPDYYPVMENGTVEATRKKMETAFETRGGAENLKLLDEATSLRAQAAHLLGYQSHVDFVAADRMAKDQKTIAAFLARMRTGLEPALNADIEKMRALKVAQTHDDKAIVNAWDWRFEMNQIKKRDYAIDDEEVRAYFPADRVLSGMFQVYSTIFGIELKEVALTDAWAEGVKLYEVHDATDHHLIAKFYVDLYPRAGKYGHAAEFTMSPGHRVDGGYSIPLACLVVNFQPPVNGKGAQLSMDEVDTLFHEFGHVMHESLTTARYTSQSGTHTALDFVEAPSQMLENWAFQPEVLALVSQDPKDATKTLPADLAKRLLAARKYDAGVRYSRQVFLGSFDQAIHTSDHSSSDVVAKEQWANIMKMPEDKDAHFAGTFGHMMGGYDGGYYGYLWSEVFAADMFTRFHKDGVLNATVGKQYRDRILARGRTVEPGVLLKDFLGRAPNEDAFLQMLGLDKKVEKKAEKAESKSAKPKH